MSDWDWAQRAADEKARLEARIRELEAALESFKIRYQDEVNARVNAEDELDTVRSGFVAELREAKAALAETRMAFLHQSELLAQARELLARYGTLSEWDKDYAPAIDAFLDSPSPSDNAEHRPTTE